jgi:type II secretory pathway pseudopilin PulG
MEQQVNLYQPILGAEKRLFSARAIVLGLGMLVVCLAALAGYASWRAARVERAIAALERQQTARLALAERAAAAMRPKESLAELDAAARGLSADIAARELALGVVRNGAPTPGAGFAERLEALARRQIEGLWLKKIVLSTGDSRLAFEGATTEPRLVPAYLAALAEERPLDGARFDRLAMRRAKPDEAPARTVFELGAAGLALPPAEDRK